jgi:hypothetical protein
LNKKGWIHQLESRKYEQKIAVRKTTCLLKNDDLKANLTPHQHH